MASTTEHPQQQEEVVEAPLLQEHSIVEDPINKQDAANSSLVGDSFHLDNTLFESSSDTDLNTTLTATIFVKKNLIDTFEQTTQSKKNAEIDEVHSKQDNLLAHSEGAAFPEDTSVHVPVCRPPINSSLSVFLRLRPAVDSTVEIILPTAPADALMGPTSIRAIPPVESNAYKSWRGPVGDPTSLLTAKEYTFTGVFGPHTQQADVYSTAVNPLVAGVMKEASSALVFCYGITNAGKTHTLTGPEKALNQKGSHDSWGLVPRALQDLVTRLPDNTSGTLALSCFEIYNEQIFDLLANNNTHGIAAAPSNHTSDTHVLLRGVSSHSVISLDDGLALLAQAQRSRRSGTNRINRDSSRSHAVYQFRVVSSDKPTADLWMVDLAGSERTKRTGGGRLQETSSINMSLMTLNRCLTALRDNQESKTATMIPYRESKLTQLFAQHWMSASAARTTMIVNVNPTATDFDETQHVLAYATAAKTIRMAMPKQKKAVENSKSEYGYDGRRKKKTMGQKVSKMIQKLSPKRLGKRKPKDKEEVASKKARMKDENISSVDVQLEELRQAEAAALLQTERQRIRAELEMEMEAKWEAKCEAIREATENEVRTEVAQEWDEQMNLLQDRDQARIEQFKEQLKAAEQNLQRTRQEHIRSRTKWEQQHKEALMRKDDEIAILRKQLAEVNCGKETTTDDGEGGDSDTSTVVDEEVDENHNPKNGEEEHLLYPNKAPKRDRLTGTYVRPRGRAPQGVETWDENRGAWRRSILE